MKRNGFTLIELIIVVAIIGIISAIAIPSFRSMYLRNALGRGKATVQSAILRVKSHIATGTDDWQIIFDGTVATHTISLGPIGSAIEEVDTLPRGITFSPAALITFEFYRGGTANSNPPGNLSFSIMDKKNAGFLFTLIPQIGEVKIDVR